MKAKFFFLICLIFNFVSIAKAQTYCDFIHKVRKYQNSIKLNEHLNDEYPIPEVDTTSFDINVYMSFFDKLTLKAGNKMYLVNYYGIDAGMPALCIKDTAFNEDKFVAETIIKYKQNIDSIVDHTKSGYLSENFPEDKINRMVRFWENQKKSYTRNSALIQYAMDSASRACNNLIPEDTPEGYLQYLFFNQMGEQFALYWHSYYIEKTVICDERDIELYLDHYSKRQESFEYSKSEIMALLHVDLSPIVLFDSTEYMITWYEIHTHSGIFKRTYSIERKYPFKIKKTHEEAVATISINFFY